MPRIVVADDDRRICDLVAIYCRREGFHVIPVYDGTRVLPVVRSERPHVVVLDLMFPGADGLEICRTLRAESDVPIILLTAKDDDADRVLGLELGADDYVTKPFYPRELVARIKAVLRRLHWQSSPDGSQVLTFRDLEIDLAARSVKVGGQPLALRPKEFDLLAFLARNPGRVLSREQLLEDVWGYDFTGDCRTVDTHVKRLRRRLGPAAGRYIVTIWGIGYRFDGVRV